LVRQSVSPQISPNTPVRGRPFTKGNSGRKLGSRNRATVIASGLLEGDAEALVRKAVELAKAGDVPMLRFLIDRILPRDRTIKFDLPQMDFADDGVAALGRIMRAVSEGAITSAEGAQLAAIVNSYTAAIDMADVVKRVDALEAQLKDFGR
jgi:hypothetical protein